MTYTSKPIASIAVKFWQYSLAEYQQAHHKLNTQYAGLIANINDIFSDNERIIIQALFTSKVVESIDLPTEEDIAAKVIQMINSCAMTL